LLGLANILGIS